MSIVGGGIIGFLIGITVIVENKQCADEWKINMMESVLWGLIGGGLGSLVRFEAISGCRWLFTIKDI